MQINLIKLLEFYFSHILMLTNLKRIIIQCKVVRGKKAFIIYFKVIVLVEIKYFTFKPKLNRHKHNFTTKAEPQKLQKPKQ